MRPSVLPRRFISVIERGDLRCRQLSSGLRPDRISAEGHHVWASQFSGDEIERKRGLEGFTIPVEGLQILEVALRAFGFIPIADQL